MKKWTIVLLLLVISLLTACGGTEEKETETATEPNKLIVGVTAGPHEQIMEKVAELAAKDGLEIELKIFSDYVMPNTTLDEGEIDVNSFQTIPFFEQAKADRGLKIEIVFSTVTFPMGIYSDKITSIDDIPEGALLGIPNDPTQEGRALLLFEQAGVIKLKDGVGQTATPLDIVENPKNVEFLELEAAQIPRQLTELNAAAINTNFAMEAGLSPKDDSIFLEGADSPYVNIIASRSDNKDSEAIKILEKAYHSEEVKAFIESEFKGSVIASW